MARDARKRLALRTPMPVRLLRRAAHAAENLPLASEAFRRIHAVEDWALAELKQRMESLTDAELSEARRRAVDPDLLAAMLAELLADADVLTPEQAKLHEYAAVLGQLGPDQAKMLAVLAAGRIQPVVHVGAGLPAAPVRYLVLENATALGRAAGVNLRDDVPRLMTQLRMLGLVELGPEDDGLQTEYEILEAETIVRDALTYVKETLRLWPRVQRHTVSLSAFGQGLWEAAAPASTAADTPPS